MVLAGLREGYSWHFQKYPVDILRPGKIAPFFILFFKNILKNILTLACTIRVLTERGIFPGISLRQLGLISKKFRRKNLVFTDETCNLYSCRKKCRDFLELQRFSFAVNLPIIQNGLLINLNLPTQPWYLERHPELHSLMMNSKPNQMTITTSRLKRADSISTSYSWSSIVDRTLRPRHKKTTRNLKNIKMNILVSQIWKTQAVSQYFRGYSQKYPWKMVLVCLRDGYPWHSQGYP